MKFNSEDLITFGKLKGEAVYTLFTRKYYPYLVWLRNNVEWFELSESAQSDLEEWLNSLPTPTERSSNYKPMDNHNDLETDVYGISGPNGGWGSFM